MSWGEVVASKITSTYRVCGPWSSQLTHIVMRPDSLDVSRDRNIPRKPIVHRHHEQRKYGVNHGQRVPPHQHWVSTSVTKIKEDVNMLFSHFCTVHSIVTTITSIMIIIVPILIQSGEGTEPPRKHNSWKNVEVTPRQQ